MVVVVVVGSVCIFLVHVGTFAKEGEGLVLLLRSTRPPRLNRASFHRWALIMCCSNGEGGGSSSRGWPGPIGVQIAPRISSSSTRS